LTKFYLTFHYTISQ